MTLPAGMNFDDDAGAKPGTGLAPVAETPGIDHFLAAMAQPEAPRPRSWRMRIFDYSAHAAMIAGLIGFAWMVSDHVVHRPATTPTAAAASAPKKVAGPDGIEPDFAKPEYAKPEYSRPSGFKADPATPGEMTELRRNNARMTEDIKALRADIALLKSTVARDQTREQIRSLSAGVDGISNGLASARTETSSAIAQLAGKIDRMQRGVPIDTGATGSLPPKPTIEAKAAPMPPVKPAKLAGLDDRAGSDPQSQKPATIPGWTVLDVYEGVALVEGKHGAMEVMPGVTVPGAGVVRSIDRSGGGWTVTTTKGVIAFGTPGRYARHVNTREPSYRGYRYDF